MVLFADYDNHEEWTITDVELVLDTASAAFQNWLSIRAHPMAGDYLCRCCWVNSARSAKGFHKIEIPIMRDIAKNRRVKHTPGYRPMGG